MTALAMKFFNSGYRDRLGRLGFEPIDCSKGFDAIDPAKADKIRVIITSGVYGASAEDMDRFPNLGIISCVGTGFESVDIEAARKRGILVTHGAGINAAAVADQAFALLLSLVRGIPQQDRIARSGGWSDGWEPAPLVSGKSIGIYGLGRIGEAIARRAEAFDMPVSYCSRTPKPRLPYAFKPSLKELAADCDFLVCSVPGGPETFHAVNAEILEALGPKGFLVNVGRGSVVSTDDLVAALSGRKIAGAALDVYETEPVIPEPLRKIERTVLTLHTGARAPEMQDISAALMARNINAFLQGQPVSTPVPGMPASFPTGRDAALP